MVKAFPTFPNEGAFHYKEVEILKFLVKIAEVDPS
jgi:hypothetical protein